MVQTALNHVGNLSDYLKGYKYQRDLTAQLDSLADEPFSQETINEIVLWKINRYVPLSESIRRDLHALRALSPKEHSKGEHAVASATTFFVELGASPVNHLLPLVLGGLLAAPVGGWAVQRISARVLMSAVGTLIVLLSLFQLARLFKLI